MTHRRTYRIVAPFLAFLVAVGLLLCGQYAMSYKVFDEKPEDNDPFMLFENITDAQMVIEGTYHGVSETEQGWMYFNYDRAAALSGFKPCPT